MCADLATRIDGYVSPMPECLPPSPPGALVPRRQPPTAPPTPPSGATASTSSSTFIGAFNFFGILTGVIAVACSFWLIFRWQERRIASAAQAATLPEVVTSAQLHEEAATRTTRGVELSEARRPGV